MGVGIALLAVPSLPAGDSGLELLNNGGFEAGLRDWQQACASPSCGTVDASGHRPRTGEKGLTLSCTHDGWTSLQPRAAPAGGSHEVVQVSRSS